jgi:acetyl-CoA acetyltransferase
MSRRAGAVPAIVGVDDGASDNEARPCVEIGARAAVRALADAGLALSDVDGVLAAYAWEEPSLMFASELADYLGLTPDYAETVCFGGASPAMMVARATRAIEAGVCEVALLMVASNRRSKLGRAAAIAALRDVLSPEFEVPYGAFVPPVYALAAARHMHERGTTSEHLAAIAVTQREHALQHPQAEQRAPLTEADVLASPIIAAPLRLLDCCLITDFGGALVIVGPETASRLAQRVWVLGAGEAHGRLSTAEAESLTSRGAARSGARALRQAGVGTEDIDFAELYDSFTITVLATLEDLGFCEPGTAGPLAVSGAFWEHGMLPVNTNGGMLSYRTGGLSHVVEAVHQLRGTAPGLRLRQPRLGLVHGIGGVLSAHCTLVLGGDT